MLWWLYVMIDCLNALSTSTHRTLTSRTPHWQYIIVLNHKKKKIKKIKKMIQLLKFSWNGCLLQTVNLPLELYDFKTKLWHFFLKTLVYYIFDLGGNLLSFLDLAFNLNWVGNLFCILVILYTVSYGDCTYKSKQ